MRRFDPDRTLELATNKEPADPIADIVGYSTGASSVEEVSHMNLELDGVTIRRHLSALGVAGVVRGRSLVDDIKLVLATHDADTRDRYALQTAFCVWLLERQLGDDPVQGHVTCLGEYVKSTVSEPPIDSIHSWLSRLAH